MESEPRTSCPLCSGTLRVHTIISRALDDDGNRRFHFEVCTDWCTLCEHTGQVPLSVAVSFALEHAAKNIDNTSPPTG